MSQNRPIGEPLSKQPEVAPVASALGEETGDARLVEQARNGDQTAFSLLVFRYERKLIRVLARLVQDQELARDLAQETFWKVYNRLDRFDTSRRFGPWLFQVGVHLGVDQLRRREVPRALFDLDDGLATDGMLELADPDPRIRDDLAQEVRHILNMLPVPERTVLLLRDLEGFSSAEVAAIVQRRETTVRWRLARAREQFRRIWLARDGRWRQETEYVG